MNNRELWALRNLFMLDAAEAAEHIGKVSVRSWRYWESGQRTVPADVAEEMTDLALMRKQMLDARAEQIEVSGERIKLNFYPSIEAFKAATGKANVVMWRLTQSVAADLYAEGLAELVDSGGLPIDVAVE